MKVLHSAPITAHIPIIALNACAPPLDIRQGQETGRFNHPIEITPITDALDAAMWHSPSTNGLPDLEEPT